MRKLILTILLTFILMNLSLAQGSGGKCSISGKICDSRTLQPLEFATIAVRELNIGGTTDMNGKFIIVGVPKGSWHLATAYLGYTAEDVSIVLQKDTVMTLFMDPLTLELKEVNVMASAQQGNSTKVKQTALAHIQPSSLNDVLQLLPGHLSSDGDMSGAQKITMRQAGSDDNTSLGTAIVSDGVPVSNNGRLDLVNSTSNSKESDRSMSNSGTDLRLISTDHLEEVEVIAGIAPVKFGDLSSGVVITKAKSGVSPWEMRVKSNPFTKTAYVGKGIQTGSGVLHVGADVSYARPDVRYSMTGYTRISAQFNYTDNFLLANRKLDYNAKVYYVGTIDKDKNDPDVTTVEENYRNKYNSVTFSTNGKWNINAPWLNKIEASASVSYTSDVTEHDKSVSLSGSVAVPIQDVEGESEGLFLPATYMTTYKAESKPLNVFLQLSAISLFNTSKYLNHRTEFGGEFRYDKNIGDGLSYDRMRPPFPSTQYGLREVHPKDIPALEQSALFAEDKIRFDAGKHHAELYFGVRLTGMQNLSSESYLHNRWYAEPRVNVLYRIPIAKEQTLTLRGGYGEQMKFPTLNMFYPADGRYNVIEANYFPTEEANRFLWVKSLYQSRTNNDLKANRNQKYEVGFDYKNKKTTISVTAFKETSNSGFASSAIYFPIAYTKYTAPNVLPEGKPTINELVASADTVIKSYSFTRNAVRLVKRGLEYRIILPKCNAINTNVEINGAYYSTDYDSSLPEYYYPSSTVNGSPYKYVGLYNRSVQNKRMEQFNTNFWFNTHISRFRLIFSTMVQCVWINSTRRLPIDPMPISYISQDGVEHPFTATQANDTYFQWLIRTSSDNAYKTNEEPIAVGINLKTTKEIGDHVRLSFLVNRLWDYNKVYTNINGITLHTWQKPHFSMELTIKL